MIWYLDINNLVYIKICQIFLLVYDCQSTNKKEVFMYLPASIGWHKSHLPLLEMVGTRNDI